jgi:uroporphyrinogen III methyltransferase/synthase
MEKGTVYLVGAGPGDVGLLTVRGAELLGRAKVVVYDALCNPSLLKLVSPEAEIIFGGKRAADHAIAQDQLNKLLIVKASEGKTVVRLKGGDPFVFGRGGEEAEKLAEADVPFEIVPGISSTIAAPAYAGIPVTHRDHCSSYTVITGHEQPEKGDQSAIDWQRLAGDPGTKIVLMGVDRIRAIADRLMENGLAADTPVGMVRWGTTGRQQTLCGQLDSIAELVDKNNFQPPAVTIIGSVVGLREKLNWFEKRPLFGQRVVVTRTRQQASALSSQLEELGAEVLEIPTIRIEDPDDKITLKDGLLGLGSYQWFIFTSPNGVERFFDYFFRAFDDIRDIGGCRIAAIGPATAAKLKDLHLNIDLMPKDYTAVGVAKAFKESEYFTIENENVALFRAQVANPELPKALEKLGAIVDDIPVYKTVPETNDVNGAVSMLEEGGADWITFTSSSTVENFDARFGIVNALQQHEMKPISIGPETSKTLRDLGVEPAIEASTHTIPGVVAALREVAGG